MTNFNGLSPWANMLNYLNAVKQLQNNPNSVNSQPSNPNNVQNNMQILQNLSTNVFTKIPDTFFQMAVEPQKTNLQDVLKMENEVVQKYLQNLLNMPESMEKLVNALNNKDANFQSYQFLKMFVENMLNNKELNQLLNQNSNEAIQKLLDVISQSLKYNMDTSQLKEILSVLNVIHTTSSINTNTLRELFLLYIPIDFQVYKQNNDFKKFEEEHEEKIKNSILSIMIETYNFSNVLVILNGESNVLSLQICAIEDFPFEMFKKYIIEFSKGNSLNVLCDFLKIKSEKNSGKSQDFKVISQNYIPVNIMNTAYFAIRTIFKIDNDISNIEK